MIGAIVRREPAERDERRRFLAHTEVAMSARDRLVLAAILRADTVADLRPVAQVNNLLPHDAIFVLERTDPDIVLVESRALTGSGAWAGGGEPSVVDPAAHLLEILDIARELDRPTVLWWSGPRHETPALIPFESRFDLVLSARPGPTQLDAGWTPGVQLARFNPIGGRRDRPVHPVAHGRWDHVPARTVQAFTGVAMAELVDRGLALWIDADAVTWPTWLPEPIQAGGVERVEVADLPDRYRKHGLFLADPLIESPGGGPISTTVLRQLASGARVVTGPDERLTSALGPWVELAADPDAVPPAVHAAIDLGPRSSGDQRSLLRTLFRQHDTSGAMSALAHRTGAPIRTTGHDVCVIAHLRDPAESTAFADAVLLQEHRPAEAVILADDPTTARLVIAEMERAGILARTLPPGANHGGLARRAADHAKATWLWLWTPGSWMPRAFLLDAVAAGLMTGAAAVGRTDRSEDGFVEDLIGDGQIVRRVAAATLPDPGDGWNGWSDQGARLFGLASDDEER